MALSSSGREVSLGRKMTAFVIYFHIYVWYSSSSRWRVIYEARARTSYAERVVRVPCHANGQL